MLRLDAHDYKQMLVQRDQIKSLTRCTLSYQNHYRTDLVVVCFTNQLTAELIFQSADYDIEAIMIVFWFAPSDPKNDYSLNYNKVK